MTEGISKERVLKLFMKFYGDEIERVDQLEEAIVNECTELDPWLPIDERAKESKKPLLVKNGDDIDLCVWREDLQIWYPSYFEPTHYKLLPMPPAEQPNSGPNTPGDP